MKEIQDSLLISKGALERLRSKLGYQGRTTWSNSATSLSFHHENAHQCDPNPNSSAILPAYSTQSHYILPWQEVWTERKWLDSVKFVFDWLVWWNSWKSVDQSGELQKTLFHQSMRNIVIFRFVLLRVIWERNILSVSFARSKGNYSKHKERLYHGQETIYWWKYETETSQ